MECVAVDVCGCGVCGCGCVWLWMCVAVDVCGCGVCGCGCVWLWLSLRRGSGSCLADMVGLLQRPGQCGRSQALYLISPHYTMQRRPCHNIYMYTHTHTQRATNTTHTHTP